ncbi:MAG: acyl-CoA dehydrogenase family protein, partial [Bacteroidia bacterium]|nr:acyl-CoA dehydrogenase family protein [Bacteroidia bacterium]
MTKNLVTANAENVNGGEFLLKSSTLNDTFIPEELNEEQNMVRQMCKDFIIDAGDKGGQLDKQVELLDQAGSLGLLGAHIPEAYGGMGMDTHTNTLICEELGGFGGGFTTSFAAHTGIGTLPILYFGTEEQKQKYLPKLASGELKAAYCLTEPSSGSDALAAKTRADLSEDGQHYILNGQKMWISNAGFADVFIVFAKIDGEHFTGFIVEKGTEGMSLGAEEKKMGIKGSSTRQVFFENAKVPVENLLGEYGKGHLIAFNILNVGRFKLGALSLGGMKSGVTTSVKYANERIQFGSPISSFGAIQHKLAEMAIKTVVLESQVYRISHLLSKARNENLDAGMSYAEALMKAAEEYAIECSITKVVGSEFISYTVDEMVQIHGGNGFSEEYPAAGAYRDARITRIYEGTNEINRMLSVSMMLKKAMSGSIDLVTPAWAVQKELATPVDQVDFKGEMDEERYALAQLKKLCLMVLGAVAKQQMDGKLNLKNEQEILMNIADMFNEIFNVESLILRIDKLNHLGQKENIDMFTEILKVYLTDAVSRSSKFATDAVVSFAEESLLVALLGGIKRYTT